MRKRAVRSLAILAAVAFLAIAGTRIRSASTEESESPRSEPRSMATPGNLGDSARADQILEKQVLHELRMLPYFSVFDNLEFRVKNREVVLSGQVVRPLLKSDAENVVKKLEGVERVVNRIEVLPVSFHDDRVRLAVYRAVFSMAPLQRYALQPVPPIHIIVRHGHVTLVGVVANEADRNLANIAANGVAGAFSVTNKLRVEQRKS